MTQAPTLQLQNAKWNLALFMLSIGVPLLMFGSFGVIRQAFAGAAIPVERENLELPPSLYNRSAESTPTPPVSDYDYQVPTATPGAIEPTLKSSDTKSPPGCRTIETEQKVLELHCWGGMSPVLSVFSDEELIILGGVWFDDDSGQTHFYQMPSGAKPADTTNRNGFSTHTGSRNVEYASISSEIDEPTGYTTSSGMRSNRRIAVNKPVIPLPTMAVLVPNDETPKTSSPFATNIVVVAIGAWVVVQIIKVIAGKL